MALRVLHGKLASIILKYMEYSCIYDYRGFFASMHEVYQRLLVMKRNEYFQWGRWFSKLSNIGSRILARLSDL